MTNQLRASLLGLLFVSLAALPAAAQSIPPGLDYWVTPNNGQTFFDFPAGDVESLCSLPPMSGWNHRVVLKGVPIAADYDTVVKRLDTAVFAGTSAQTRIIVQGLKFASAATQSTPCGALDWQVGLAGAQSITLMKLRRTSSQGGLFSADIAVNVEFRAYKAGSSVYVGSLFYNIVLPDPQSGTPWSFGPGGVFRAGMTPTNNCLDVLRQKLGSYSPTSSHHYFISNMIAAGQCTRQTTP